MTPPLLALDDARIEAGGTVLASSLTFAAEGPRVVVVGDTEPLFGPLLRRAHIATGAFSIEGAPLDRARSSMGLAPFDPPLPPDMTVLEYVTWSARLAGKHARDAARLAKEACERASLTDMAMRRLGELGLVPRRLAVLAQAAVVPSSLVVADHPLRGLDAASAGFVLARLAKLVGEANVVVSTARFEAESPAESLARGASTVVVLAGGRALEVAPPSGIRTLWRVNEAETSPHAAEDAASSPTEAP